MTARTKDPEPGALELREERGILPAERPIIESLGIPVGLIGDDAEPGEVMAEILARIAAAGSVEEALAQGAVAGLQDYEGRVIGVVDFKYQPSAFDPGGWPFVVINAVADPDGGTGEAVTLTTGAKQVVAMLALARKLGGLPFKARVEVIGFEGPEGELRRAVKLVSA